MMIQRMTKKHLSILFPVLIMLLICCVGIAFGSSGGEQGAEKGWATTDWYRVMNFAVLFGILFYFLRKPVSDALNGRIKGIKEELDELESKKSEAEQKLAEYKERIAALDQESEKIIAEYIRQGEEAKGRILKESEKAAAKLEDQAKRNIEQEFEKAKRQLQADILEKALARAEALVKDKITSDDQDRLVDEYLDKVVA